MKNSLFVKDDVSAGHGKTPAPPRATVLFFRKIFFYFLLLFSSRSRSTTFFFLHRSGYFVFLSLSSGNLTVSACQLSNKIKNNSFFFVYVY